MKEFDATRPGFGSSTDSVVDARRVDRAPGGSGAASVAWSSAPSIARGSMAPFVCVGAMLDCRGLGMMSTFGRMSSSREYGRVRPPAWLRLSSLECPSSSMACVPKDAMETVRARALGSKRDERPGDGGRTAKGFASSSCSPGESIVPREPYDVVRPRALGSKRDARSGDGGLTAKGLGLSSLSIGCEAKLAEDNARPRLRTDSEPLD